MSVLNLTTHTVNSSTIKKSLGRSQRLLDICKHLDASCYVSGMSGKEYLDEEIFQDSGIKIIYENFQHPTYKQIHGNFIENISILDLFPRSSAIHFFKNSSSRVKRHTRYGFLSPYTDA